jgi:non-specific serine/threonine protein kinase
VEVAGILRLMDEGTRLVTLTGPGGIGKTRLAQEVATEALRRFPDGVYFIDLSLVRDAASVLPALVSGLGVQDIVGEPSWDTLGRYFAECRMLLVLDNWEQVLEAAAGISALFAVCRHLTLLATSREPLRLRAERVFPVPPLALANTQHLPHLRDLAQVPSIALFIAHAQAVAPSFTLTEANAPAVAAICQRLDGLPLAIELAAARVRLLPPPRLLTRLERALPLLTGGTRDAPERQRTLRQAIAWSYDLLSPSDQTLFRSLAVFVGGCTIDAVETVAGFNGTLDVLEGLASLTDKNLLVLDESTAEPRYRMLETIREYAMERLAASPDEEQIRRSHLAYLLQLAAENDLDRASPVFEERLARLGAEEGNLRAALEWGLIHDPEGALALNAGLGQFWWVHGRLATGLDLHERILATEAGAPAPARAQALAAAAWLAINLGDLTRAGTLADAAFTLAEALGASQPAAFARYCQGDIAMSRGEGERATPLLEDALARFEVQGDMQGASDCLTSLGLNALNQGDATAAVACFERSLTIADAHQGPRYRARALVNLAWAHHYLGQQTQAEDFGTQALALADQVGSAHYKADALAMLSLSALDRGEVARAAALNRESLRLWWEFGDKWGLTYTLEIAAAIIAAADLAETAVRLYGAAEALRAISLPITVLAPSERERHRAAVRAALDESTFVRAWTEGQRVPLATAVTAAIEKMAAIPEHQSTDQGSTVEEDR